MQPIVVLKEDAPEMECRLLEKFETGNIGTVPDPLKHGGDSTPRCPIYRGVVLKPNNSVKNG